jgi:hypothetical protein
MAVYNPAMEQAARERLEAKRQALIEQREEVQNALLIAAVMACVCWFALGYIGLIMALKLDGWLDAHAQWLNVTMLCLLVLAGIIVPPVALPRAVEQLWERHYAYIGQLLRTTDAGQLLFEPERWERVHEYLEARPWLKLSALSRPATLEAQVEFAADHWRALIALTDSRRPLARALWLDHLTRLSDETVVFLFNGCAVWVLLLLSGLLLFAGLLPFIPLTLWYVQNQAAQAAIIDYLLE